MLVFTFVIWALACARLTGLITSDRITEQVRMRLVRRFCRDAPADDCTNWRAYLLLCQWCMSIWVAALFAPLWWLWGDSPWLLVPVAFLAFSQITGMLSSIGR